MLLTTGIKIDPCQYRGSKYADQNNKLINSLTNHSDDRALLTTGTKIKISWAIIDEGCFEIIFS